MTVKDTKWTNEQIEAITDKDRNLLVAAAAGAGKTAVLVERIIRRITCEENPVDIDKLLVVTFTNAAATEMRERIADAISDILDENPDSKLLQRQLALLNKAHISTIHSFCLDVIKNNFHCIGLNPNFRIADEIEALLIKTEVLDELFEEIYERDEVKREFFDLLDSYAKNKDDRELKEIVFSLNEFIREFPWPENWLWEKVGYFNMNGKVDFGQTIWGELLLKNAEIELENLRVMMEKAILLIQTDESLEPYYNNFIHEIENIDFLLELCKNGIWDEFYKELSVFEFQKLPNCKKNAPKDTIDYVKEIRNAVKAKIKKFQNYVFYASSDEIYEELKKFYPMLKHLSEITIEFNNRYLKRKEEKSILDFNDLEHFCLDILLQKNENGKVVPSDAALGYREIFEEILVDEYQDSNLIQDVILNVISRKDLGTPNIFMVGDVKQSIYRFRHAMPELFLEKYNAYPEEKDNKYRKIKLYKNFRSREGIIDFVNFIFSKIMSKYIGEMDYGDEESLKAGANFADLKEMPEGPWENKVSNITDTNDKYDAKNPKDNVKCCTEIHIIETGKNNKESGGGTGFKIDGKSQKNDDSPTKSMSKRSIPIIEDYESEWENQEEAIGNADLTAVQNIDEEFMENARYEAKAVAKKISELVGLSVVYDKKMKAARPAEYRDIVILLRSTKDLADIFMEELIYENIPVYADTNAGFFKIFEVQIMVSLLQIIDNPLQDIPLLAVLRSPFMQFSPDELTEIRLIDKNVSFYEALKLAANANREELLMQDDFEKIELANKASKFLQSLEKWREKALYMSTDELVWSLYSDTGFYSYVGALPDGEQRQANLRMLFEEARQYEKTAYKGLFNFVNFISKLKSGSGDMGSAKILGESENVVRIMSIHKSKGLEFPIVIISGCGRGFNLRDMNKSIIFHRELGFGPDYVDTAKRLAYPSVAKQALRCKIKAESLSEEMRILYVGLTRAREQLILTGTVKDIGESISNWSVISSYSSDGKIPSSVICEGRNYFDWICPAVMTDNIHKNLFFGVVSDTSKQLFDIKLWKRDNININKMPNDIIRDGKIDESFQNEDKTSVFDAKKRSDDLWDIWNTDAKPSDYYDEVKRRLEWEYRYKEASRIPVKVSVTELKRKFAYERLEEFQSFKIIAPPLIKKPAFLEKKGKFDAVQIGTIMHFVMQHVDLKRVDNIEQIIEQVNEMVQKELLSEQQANIVDSKKIFEFFRSDIGKRMLKSPNIRREVPFNAEIIISDLYPDLKGSIYDKETLLLQGVIDCFFEEEYGLVLLDYKTDYVDKDNEQYMISMIKEQYKVQMEYYSIVLERLLGKKVKEKYIYLFANGGIIRY